MAVADQFETVQKLYIAFYQRPADFAGRQYWAEQVEAQGLSSVINAFATSAEATALYGEINADTIGDVIDQIYTAAFGRPADEAGKAWYIEQFNAGEFTAATIALNVVNGATGDDATTLGNKVEAADLFTAAVENVEYNEADITAARDFLAGVTATVPTQAEVDAVVEQIGTEEPGEFTLTEGLTDLQDAQAALTAALKAVAEADLTDATKADGEAVAEDDPATTNVNELQVAIDAYTADDAKAEVTAAAQAVADAEASVLNAEANLTSARATKFTDAAVLTLDGVTADTYMTDANVAAAVTEAQANVNAAKSLYLEDGTIVANETGVAQAGYQKIYLANNVLTTDSTATGAVLKGYVATTAADTSVEKDVTNATGTDSLDPTTEGTPAEILVTVNAGFSGTLTIGGVDYTVTDGTVAGLDTYVSGGVAGVESISQSGTTVTVTGTLVDTDDDSDGVAEDATDLSTLVISQSLTQTIFTADDIEDTVTAAQLQTLAAGAAADLAAAEASSTNAELLAELRAAINTFVGAEGDVTTVVDGANTLGSIRTAIANILDDDTLTEEQVATQSKALVATIAGYADADDAAGEFADFVPVTTDSTTDAEEKGILNALNAIADRQELITEAAATKANFEGTATGTVLAAAEALQEGRDDLVEAIATAQEDLADAQAYNENLTALIEAHTAAGADVTAAEEALAEAGVDSVITLTENSNGTLFGADVFLYSPETAAATIGRFEADDQLFIGDYAVVMLGEGEELLTDRLGDSAVLEVFVGQNAQGDAVFSFETQAFAGNAQSVADIETITITGVAVDELAISGGFVTLV